MSSSSSPAGVVRGRVLRGGGPLAPPVLAPRPAELERDLSKVSTAVQAWSPEQVAAAIAEGYREGHEQGRSEGFAQGMEDGLAQAAATEAARQAGTRSAMEALVRAVDEIHTRHRDATVAAEDSLIEAAVALAEAVIGAELRDGAAVRAALARSLRLVTPEAEVSAAIHPEDLATIAPPGSGAAALTWDDPTTGRCVHLVADDRVERGGCVVDAGDLHIDAQLGPALERARAALAGLDPEEATP